MANDYSALIHNFVGRTCDEHDYAIKIEKLNKSWADFRARAGDPIVSLRQLSAEEYLQELQAENRKLRNLD